MTAFTFHKLNLLTLPLHGTRLIEASAGTGKTYTLVSIYLCLLLGIGGAKIYRRPLSVKDILVVTFTEIAAKELRNRIYNNIHQLRMACVYGYSEDFLISLLLSEIHDRELAINLLFNAERQIDDAAIFTIHGFCQRILNQNVIETGMLFQHTLLEDESELYQQIINDFWRRHCYPLPIAVSSIVQQYWNGPESILKELLPYLQGELPKLYNPLIKEHDSIIECHNRIIDYIDELKKQWLAARNIKIVIDRCCLDRRSYNKYNIENWLHKLNQWANESTVNYDIPKELERFRSSVLSKNTRQDQLLYYPLFESIEIFYKKNHIVSLRELILVIALNDMRNKIKQEKLHRAEIGFSDLINRIDVVLATEGGEKLAQIIRNRYPVAMIDEFQDTDPQQYRIFYKLYSKHLNYGLILIGDPKQAIYGFRGADIFTYLRARMEVNAYYSLDTNWRSSSGMINAVNNLFQFLPNPFIFQEISFQPMAAAPSNTDLKLIIEQEVQPAMSFWLPPIDCMKNSDSKNIMAEQCASTIRNWLFSSQYESAWLEDNTGNRKSLQASDITILVRNSDEAALIQEALAIRAIPTVYFSNRDSIFNTLEARELLWLLQGVLEPERDNTLRCALATNLLGFNSADIWALNNNEQRWDQLFEEFTLYRTNWQRYGVLPMLQQIITKYCIAKHLLSSISGERRLTNLLQLCDLLQETSFVVANEVSLVRWLALQIEKPNRRSLNYHPWLESDRNLVKIMTIHKSKGLEFPIVFLPFAASVRHKQHILFHDRQNYRACLDLKTTIKSKHLANEERLAEDIRLLYVALTRSIYHCSIGISPLSKNKQKKYKKVVDNYLSYSALEYIIQQGTNSNIELLRNNLNTLIDRAKGDINMCNIQEIPPVLPLRVIPTINQPLSARLIKYNRNIDSWRVTSYTELHQYDISSRDVDIDLASLQFNINHVGENCAQNVVIELTPHTFPRGKNSGNFLHKLFEILNFSKHIDLIWLSEKLKQYNIEEVWCPIIKKWIEEIITTPLNDLVIMSLIHLPINTYKVELPFYLSINNPIEAQEIDQLCKSYDRLSNLCAPLNFPQIQGMLTGFIDLVFKWQNQYYLLDYKSNWLGENNNAYTKCAIEQAMINHRYELQYQFYTLALHRYLRQRLINYDYQRDFGGVFYLFIRGMNAACPGQGIYYCKPDYALINGLDLLFS